MIVIDSSFFLAHVFSDEENEMVDDIFKAIERSELEAFAPNLFVYEIHNCLLTAVRKKRIKKSNVPEYLELFSLAPITVVESGSPESITKIAFTHELSFYDASYLELAMRRNIPLATLDKKLFAAADKENIAYK